MVGARAHGSEQQHHQVDRLIVHRFELHRGFQLGEHRRHRAEAGKLAVRDGDAVAEPGRAQLFAIVDGFEDGRRILARDLGCPLGQPLQHVQFGLDP